MDYTATQGVNGSAQESRALAARAEDWSRSASTRCSMGKHDQAEATCARANLMKEPFIFPALHLANLAHEKEKTGKPSARPGTRHPDDVNSVDAWAYPRNFLRSANGEDPADRISRRAREPPVNSPAARPVRCPPGLLTRMNEKTRDKAIRLREESRPRASLLRLGASLSVRTYPSGASRLCLKLLAPIEAKIRATCSSHTLLRSAHSDARHAQESRGSSTARHLRQSSEAKSFHPALTRPSAKCSSSRHKPSPQNVANLQPCWRV